MGKLRDRDMRNIIRNRKQKKKSVAWLAEYYGVTKRRIRQILAYEEKYGAAPIVHNRGRKMKKITEKEEELIVSYYLLTRLSPVYLERVIEKKEGLHIPHNRIYQVLSAKGYSSPNSRKQKQRKYHRYERNHSMSL